MITSKVEYVAAGGNRHPAAADWDRESRLLAFGADRNVALWNPLDSSHCGINGVLSGHTDKVNVVRFFPSKDSSRIILSGSVDKTIVVWVEDNKSPVGYKIASILREHSSSINSIAVYHDSSIFISGAADATIKIWNVNTANKGSDMVKLVQNIDLKPRFFPLALSFVPLDLDHTSFVLAVGGTKSVIQIYVSSYSKSEVCFSLKATLPGHEGWIRSLDFIHEEKAGGDALLASASQDKYVRLWRLHRGTEVCPTSNDTATETPGKPLSNKSHNFEAGPQSYAITFEALLLGHEDWIYSAVWERNGPKLQLLTASADNTISIWESSASSGVWVVTTRLGELSAQKGSTTATGSTGGFWIGLWSPHGDAVVSLGRTGSWRLWIWNQESKTWTQRSAISGHTKAVKGVVWERNGAFLLSTSSDQTTRLFAEWRRSGQKSWHEFSRPQIHGYDLNCVEVFGKSSFISGADEKLLRVFSEPRDVAKILKRLCGIESYQEASMPDAANMPVLGLSNKAVDSEDHISTEHREDEVLENKTPNGNNAVDGRSEPPSEDQLSRYTLWPESEKLYGHGYEISAVAASHDSSLIATACRASSIDHAVIRIFRVKDWLEIKPSLKAHSLTVARLRFSEDDMSLLSVGRDRQWAVFKRDQENSDLFSLSASNPKGHSRMILDASWAPKTPLQPKRIFGSAGRDKVVKIWEESTNGFESRLVIPESQPVTAIDFLQQIVKEAFVIAIGLEDGRIRICFLNLKDISERESYQFHSQILPSLSITQLAWRPTPAIRESTFPAQRSSHDKQERFELAATSEDSSLRIYSLSL